MPNSDLAKRLVETLPFGVDGLFNPWRDRCHDDAPANTPDTKLERLAYHLDCTPRFILCGEAPGYMGCVRSGIAFTSERLLIEGVIPRIPRIDQRLTLRRLPFSEPSATIVWKALYRLGIADHTILWNAVQLHPYRQGDHLSNRTPSPAEISLGVPAMRLLAETFPAAKVIAVGRQAEKLLATMGIEVAGAVRHPANGGATEFSNGLAAIASHNRKG